MSKTNRRMSVFVGLAALVVSLAAVPATAQTLDPVQVQFDDVNGVDGIGGPRQIVASNDGRFYYVPGELDSSIAVFKRDPQTGELNQVQALFDGVDGVEGIFGASSVAISPDGRHVYVTSAFGSAIAAFSRHPGTGKLTFVEAEFEGVDGVEGLSATVWSAVSNDGRHVYASGFADGAIVTFERDRRTGELDYVDTITGLPGVFAFELSQDGRFLYATALQAAAVVALERDRQTGVLTLIDFVQVATLSGARALQLSNDGGQIYVGSLFADSVTVLERDRGTGEIEILQTLRAFDLGAPALLDPTDVAVSNDGSTVYVAGFARDAINIFERDPATGLLTYMGAETDPAGALDGVIGIEVPNNGANAYAVGFFSDSLVSYQIER